MTRADNRPDPIEDMLAALREDDPTYTDAELDAGFNALLTDLEQLTPERAREADDLATEAELGSDAYALGLEYFERGELERATRWLRIAASHGVLAAQQQLDDARELHRTVDSLSAKPVRPHRRPGERLAQLLDCSSWPDTSDLSTLPAAASQLAEALDGELQLAQARQEAERILADARRAAAQIAADAQRAAQPDAEAAAPTHPRIRPLDRVPCPEYVLLPRWVSAPLRCRDVDFMLVTGTSDIVAAGEVKCYSDARWLRPHAARESSPKIGSLQLGSIHHDPIIARERSRVQMASSRHALLNLIGREVIEAYEQAVQENDPSCLQCHFSVDAQLASRLVVWAQTASPDAAADAHKILADLVTPSTSGLLVPISVRDLAPQVPTTTPERGDLHPGYL
ncbi:hypothetical protein [Streptomyces longwoodensis]|uniref:hypothetical protein n=1 Tax=Streptomyces longwoodensis TaxID=68231 RepID=UPI0033D49B0C